MAVFQGIRGTFIDTNVFYISCSADLGARSSCARTVGPSNMDTCRWEAINAIFTPR